MTASHQPTREAALLSQAAAMLSRSAALWTRRAALAALGLAIVSWGAPAVFAQPKPAQIRPAQSANGAKSPGSVQPGTGPVQGRQLCVSAGRANLRAGPGAKFRVTWEVNRYMPLLQVLKEGDWLKVRDVDGDLHWISDKLTTAKSDCITVKADKANIRKAPNGKAATWFTVEKYTSFRRVGQKDNWVKIEYEGETMWVAQSLVWPS